MMYRQLIKVCNYDIWHQFVKMTSTQQCAETDIIVLIMELLASTVDSCLVVVEFMGDIISCIGTVFGRLSVDLIMPS